ncbi:MAG: hypothetical protein UU16_C0040G0008 [Candidatus Woesebacteria bacterium GW2011_GWA2_40_7]|uniref:Uncharacterized protein n=1 Tax=Candidatus Woesebacteria bacterium GW2011_GWA2_40_7 TaxID=1618562 RepID=A0A0G0VKI0_9BACT|nr:MAG: hypothetical protein UU16_C0040G0008 [Candidatus Woesebacteria bacterium GW2011_GWA2_40_7]
MSVNSSEIPAEITMDVWEDFAKRGKISDQNNRELFSSKPPLARVELVILLN